MHNQTPDAFNKNIGQPQHREIENQAALNRPIFPLLPFTNSTGIQGGGGGTWRIIPGLVSGS